MSWQLQEAENRFSEVVSRAMSEGPQTVTRRGAEVVVVVSIEEYRRLAGPSVSFKDYLRQAPLETVGVERTSDSGREVDLP